MKTKTFNIIRKIILFLIYIGVTPNLASSQVPLPPDDVGSCTQDCSCLYKIINQDISSIDSKAHAYYYYALNCDTIKVKQLNSFNKAIRQWGLIDYKGHRKHNAYRILLEHYFYTDFSIDSLNHYFKLAKESPILGNSIASRNLAECYNIVGKGYGEVQDYYSQVNLFSELLNSSIYNDLVDSVKVFNLYYGVEGFLDFPSAQYIDTIRSWLDRSYELLASKPFVSLSKQNLYLSFNKYNEGRTVEKLGRYDEAIKFFKESRSYANIISYLKYEAIASTAIAENSFRIKDYSNSIKAANLALDVFERDSVRHNQNCEPYYWLAKSNRVLGNHNKVEELIFKGVNLSFDTISIQQNNIKNFDVTQSKNGEYTLRLLLELADFKFDEYRRNDNVQALETANEYYDLCFTYFHDFVSQQDNLNSRYLNKEIQIELFEKLIEIGLISGHSQSLFNIIDKNKMSIMEHNNFTSQASLTDFASEYTIIQYAFTSDSLLAVVYNKGLFSTYNLGESKVLFDLIRKYIIQLNEINDDIYITSNSLYQMLIEPLNLNCKQLIIIPDNELYHIPFGALNKSSDDTGLFLEKEFDIHYHYSASLIKEQTKPLDEGKRKMSIYIPGFLERPDRIYATIRSGGLDMELFHLPHAKSEGEYIAKEFNETLSIVSKASILDALETKGILHYAGHAVTLPDNPDFSFLALSSDVANESNKFYMKELLGLKCNNEMVVLSACETGSGKIVKGEGALSLARGFFFAGAKSVISTLWSVGDRSSSTIMKSFYTHLKKGKRKDVALRQAKLDYLNNVKDPDYLHPFYWAGFVAVGDMSPLVPKSKKTLYFGLGFILLSIFGFGFYRYRRSTVL